MGLFLLLDPEAIFWQTHTGKDQKSGRGPRQDWQMKSKESSVSEGKLKMNGFQDGGQHFIWERRKENLATA